MSEFFKKWPEVPVRVEMPGTRRSGDQFSCWVTPDAQESRSITVFKNDEEVVRVQEDGRIFVKGEEVA